MLGKHILEAALLAPLPAIFSGHPRPFWRPQLRTFRDAETWSLVTRIFSARHPAPPQKILRVTRGNSVPGKWVKVPPNLGQLFADLNWGDMRTGQQKLGNKAARWGGVTCMGGSSTTPNRHGWHSFEAFVKKWANPNHPFLDRSSTIEPSILGYPQFRKRAFNRKTPTPTMFFFRCFCSPRPPSRCLWKKWWNCWICCYRC